MGERMSDRIVATLSETAAEPTRQAKEDEGHANCQGLDAQVLTDPPGNTGDHPIRPASAQARPQVACLEAGREIEFGHRRRMFPHGWVVQRSVMTLKGRRPSQGLVRDIPDGVAGRLPGRFAA